MEISFIPRLIIRKITDDDVTGIHLNVLLSSLLIILTLLSLHTYTAQVLSVPHFCLFQKGLNAPCPGCGITRSVLSIVRGNLFLAWHHNPAGLLLFSFILAQVPLRVIAMKYDETSKIISKISRIGSFAVILSLILAWMLKLAQ